MDFGAFEQLVLRVLFETPDPLSAPHLAYLARIPVQRAERYLARMVEQGSITPRVNNQGNVEYGFAGRRDLQDARRIADEMAEQRGGEATDGAPGEVNNDDINDDLHPEVSSATAVLLSVLVPGRRPHLRRALGRRRRLDGHHAGRLRLLPAARACSCTACAWSAPPTPAKSSR